MSGWVDVAAGAIDWNWVGRVFDAGDGLPLIVWTAVFSIAFFAVGILVGRALGKRSSKGLADRCGELETRRNSLIKENERLNGRVRALESENSDLKSDIEGCKDKVAELEGKLAKRWKSDSQRFPGLLASVDTLAKVAEASVAPAGNAPCQTAEDDPMSRILPTEIPFLLRVYDEAQVHVGTENLMVARSLHRKGAVLRTDAPESGVISQCDVALTDEWVTIMKSHADELRAQA